MKLVEVLAVDGTDSEKLEEQQRFVALQFPAQYGSSVIKHLSCHFQTLAALGFAHIKRLKKLPEAPDTLMALVCPLVANNTVAAMSVTDLQQLEETFEAKLTTAEALKFPPRTRELFEKYTQHWPLIFHSSVERTTAPLPIGEDESEVMKKHLAMALQIGGKHKRERQKILSCAWGCVVVDPEIDEHAATSEINGNRWSQYAFEALYHPIMVAISRVGERDRRQNTEAEEKAVLKKHKHDGEDAKHLKIEKDGNTSENKHNDSYLCTGYDVFLDQEPCSMCAMALVHSRVRRVVFDRSNPSDGVLLSSYRLHTIKSLNHHYRVFQLALSSHESEV